MAIFLYSLLIVLPIVALNYGIRFWIKKQSLLDREEQTNRKGFAAYIYQYEGVLKASGFIISLLFTLALWNYRHEYLVIIEAERERELITDIFNLPVNTEQKKPPKPKPVLTPKIIEVEEEVVEEKKELAFVEEPPEEIAPEQGTEGDEDGEEEAEVFEQSPFSLAEVQQIPVFPGGAGAMISFIKRNYVVPPIDRRKGVTGTIYLNLLIDKEGKISEVKILKGLTSRMDNEAIRVVQKMPDWDPAYRNGIAVPVNMMLPITIKY
jgi:protein TonB